MFKFEVPFCRRYRKNVPPFLHEVSESGNTVQCRKQRRRSRYGNTCQGRDLRGEYRTVKGVGRGGKRGTAEKGENGGQKSEGNAHCGQSETRAQRDPALFGTGRKPGRSVSGGVYRAHQSHRQFRYVPRRAVQHLCRSHDRGGTAALSAGQHAHPRQPFGEGSRV